VAGNDEGCVQTLSGVKGGLPDELGAGGIHAGCGFVEEQDLGFQNQACG